MCFATISTRRLDAGPPADAAVAQTNTGGLDIQVPPPLEQCAGAAGFSLAEPIERDRIDAAVAALFACTDADEIGDLLSDLVTANFGGLVDDDGAQCLADGLVTPAGARELLVFLLDDATVDEKQPVGELVGACVLLSDALAAFGFPLADNAGACIDEAGRELLVQATIEGDLPEEQTLFRVINPCLAGD